MQDIKFRVWDKWNKQYFENLNNIFLTGNGEIGIVDKYGHNLIEEYQERFVSEFSTGIKDKNGVEIYENDIVCQQMRFDETNGVIFWQEEKARFAINLDGFITTITKPQEMSYEVVGNIHENAYLLSDNADSA